MTDWRIFTGVGEPHNEISKLPDPPKWRDFERDFDDSEWGEIPKTMTRKDEIRGKSFRVSTSDDLVDVVNAALYLRRPLLVTGKPGTGKTSLAYRIAYELNLGPVLPWSITARSALKDGLYRYDAIARLQAGQMGDKSDTPSLDIGRYINLGPVGTAMLPTAILEKGKPPKPLPRVLLIDEFDKSDINLPNDLLNLFEEGEFEIPELARMAKQVEKVSVRTSDGRDVIIKSGQVKSASFPFIILTSNGERDFPPAFLRRCLRITMPTPNNREELIEIVKAHLGDKVLAEAEPLIEEFVKKGMDGNRSADQLLNAVYLVTREFSPTGSNRNKLIEVLMKSLSSTEGE